MIKAVIFLGPSMPVSEAKKILGDAVFLPPARQADLLSAVTTYRPDVIGLIDGVFGQSLSVWHKEILFALEQGVTVLGASSMGALRAAECAELGMVGVGEVYRMFASGELTDDDEVALSHGQEDVEYRGVSEPMVNIRKTLQAAREQGVIDGAIHDELVRLAKETYFPERHLLLLIAQGRQRGLSPAAMERLQAFLPRGYVDIKRQDAVALLERVKSFAEPPRHVPSFKLTRSHLFETLYDRDRTVRHEGADVPLSSIALHAALHQPDFLELNFNALNRELAGVLAEVFQVQATPEEIDHETLRFRLRRRLKDAEALREWAARNDLSPDEFRGLMERLAVCRKMQRWFIARKYLERTTRTVLDELRLRGQYEEAARNTAQMEQLLSQEFPGFQEDEHEVDASALVLDHLRETKCRMDTNFMEWMEEAGFRDVNDLRYELIRARLSRRYMANITRELKDALAAGPGRDDT